MENDKIIWEAPEYVYHEKGREWFIVLWLIALAFLVVSIFFKNFLFAGIVILSAFSMTVLAHKRPTALRYEVNRVGVSTHKTFYPYSFLSAFWIDHLDPSSPKLLIVSNRLLVPMIVIPLGEQDPNEVRNFIGNYMEERELFEPLPHKLAEYLGF